LLINVFGQFSTLQA